MACIEARKVSLLSSKVAAAVVAAAIAMLLMAFPALARAATPANVSSVGTDSLGTLGFDTDASEAISDASSQTTPTGTTAFALFPVPELLMTARGSSGAFAPNTAPGSNAYDFGSGGFDFTHEDAGSNTDTQFLTGIYESQGDEDYSLPSGTTYSYLSSFAFDPTGSGKKDCVARVTATTNGSDATTSGSTDFTLYVTDSNKKTTSYELGRVPFVIRADEADAYTPVAAGDYDGDGYDELAVYHFSSSTHGWQWGEWTDEGNTYNDDAELDIRILDVDPKTLEIKEVQLTTTSSTGTRYAEYDLANLGFSKVSADSSNQLYKNKLYYPVIDLTTVEQPGDQYDDLVVCVSHALLSVNYAKDAATRMVFWQDPGNSNAADNAIQQFSGIWYWGSDYGLSDESNAEMMAFGGAGEANVDGDADGYNEVVVAGMRFYYSELDRTVDSDGQRLWCRSGTGTGSNVYGDLKYYLTAVYSYNPSTKQYVSHPATWVSADYSTYSSTATYSNSATYIGTGMYASLNDYVSIVYSPLEVVGFAEKGTGYADSVFVNGIICDYHLQALQNITTLPYGPSSALKSAGAAKSSDGFLFATYAYPTNLVGRNSGDSRDTAGSGTRRWIGEALAGNFDGDASGTEELVFSYGRLDGSDTLYSVMSVQKTAPGPLSDTSDLYSSSLAINRDSSIYSPGSTYLAKNYTFSATDAWAGVASCTASLAAVDFDSDSVIVRPSTERTTEYYFSDPYVVAVLQSPPYFEELLADYSFYPASGSTSISKESGSTAGNTRGFEFSSGLIFGIDDEEDFGFILNHKVSELEFSTTITAHFSSEYSSEREKTYSTTYTGPAKTDMVVLTMTPYVRYHYQTWDGDQWVETSIDVPKTPRATMVSVDTYDSVASKNGWESIRGDVLTSTPGDPATYDSNSNGLAGFDGGQTVGTSTGGWVDVGTGGTSSVGSISQGIGSTITDGYSVSSGVGIEVETSLTVGIVKVGGSMGIDATSGYSRSTFTGTTFTGTVDNLPGQVAGSYDFQWRFGCWEDSLSYADSDGRTNKSNIYVLGYLVKDVGALPKPSQDLSVVGFTEDSITLEWTHPSTAPAKYILYREEAGGFVPLAIIKADLSNAKQRYTDATCESGTTYSYRIVSVTYDKGGTEVLGPGSPIATGTTLSPSSPKVAISGDVTVQSGNAASFYAIVKPVAGGGTTAVQWQKWNGSSYIDISGATNTTYTVASATLDMDGSRYRCYVTQMVNGHWRVGYSAYATLHVTQRATTTTLASLDPDTGTCSHYDTDGRKQQGTEFYFEATVADASSSSGIPTGNVAFDVTNTSTGGHITILSKLADGIATASYVASEAGDYSVVANYRGDSIFTSSASDSKSFTVYSPKGLVLVIDGADGITYGDTMDVKARLVKQGDASSSVPVDATFKVTDAASITSTTNLVDLGGSTFDPVAASKALHPARNYVAACGGYIIQATYTVGAGTEDATTYMATKRVEVDKKDLAAKAGDKAIDLAALDSTYLDDVAISYEGFASIEDEAALSGYKSLFALYTDLGYSELYVGQHAIKVRYSDMPADTAGAASYALYMKQLLANYDVARTAGVLTVNGEWKAVTYAGAGNGTVAATTASRAPLASGDTVLKGTSLTFSAAPAAGNVVESWKYTGSSLSGTDESRVGKIEGDTNVLVTFSVQYVTLSWSVDGAGGAISAKSSSEDLTGPAAQVMADDAYTFTAAPEAGKMVGKWTVNGVEQSSRDTTLVLDGLSGDTDVQVTFVDAVTHAVKASGIDMSGAPCGSVSISPAPDAGGKIADGVAVTFTAAAPAGYKVYEWRSYAPGGTTYASLQYGGSSYAVSSLASDLDIRAVFASTVAYSLSWNTDGNGDMGAQNTATGGALVSGSTYPAGTSATFTVKPHDGYATKSVVATTSAGSKTLTLQSTSATGEETYILGMLDGNTVVAATFEKHWVSLSWAVDGSGGSISASSEAGVLGESPVQVAPEGTYAFVAAPGTGKMVSKWTVNGAVQATRDTELVLDGLSGDTDVRVSFADAVMHAVKASGIGMDGKPLGSVSISPEPDAGGKLTDGRKVVFTATAPDGYAVAQWRSYASDGTYVTLRNTGEAYTAESLASDLDIRVVFAPAAKEYSISWVAEGEGDILGAVNASTGEAITSGNSYPAGTPITFTIKPHDGYMTKSVTAANLGGSSKLALESTSASGEETYVLGALGGDTVVTAAFDIRYVNLSWSVDGTGGAISAASSITKLPGASAQVPVKGAYTFTAVPEAGKKVGKWTVNGKEQPAHEATLVLDGLSGDTDVKVSFADGMMHAVEATGIDLEGSPCGSVSISPAPDATGKIADGEAVLFTATVPSGYTAAQWRSYASDGTYAIVQYGGTSYSVASLATDLDIKAVFAPLLKYSITWAANGGGDISATDTATGAVLQSGSFYPAGTSITFAVAPHAKHATESVIATTSAGSTQLKLVSTSATGVETYVLDTLAENTSVVASFKPTASAAIALSGGPGRECAYLNWDVTLDGDPGITGYSVYRKTGSEEFSLVGTTDKDTFSHTDAGLANGTTYIYKIVATTSIGDEFSSNEFSITPEGSNLYRLWGADRFGTMLKITGDDATRPYEYGNVFKSDRGAIAIVATATGYWDALSASGLAGLLDAPVILTNPTTLSTEAYETIARLGCEDIIIAGGNAAVSDDVYNEILAISTVKNVTRVSGPTAEDTAVALFEYGCNFGSAWDDECIVVTRNGYYDALSVGPYAYKNHLPVFLTNASSNTLTDNVLSTIDMTFNDHKVIIIGGPSAVSSAVEQQLGNKFEMRKYGADRYATSVEIAEWELSTGMSADKMGITTGNNFPDALCGAALCGQDNSVLVLVSDDNRTAIDEVVKAHKAEIGTAYIFGGTQVVSASTEEAARQALE